MNQDLQGRSVIETLADTYRQLFLAPGEDGQQKYPDIVQKGEDPDSRDLSHFITSEDDSLTWEETPAGTVPVVTLAERADFVTFLRIMGNRCAMTEIPGTQGASILDGVINWRKIDRHKEEFFRNAMEQGDVSPDWKTEFLNFTKDRQNFKDALIVLSKGPYSAVPASRLDLSEEEWISLSGTIRRAHECTHFICRRLYPEKKHAVWDELVADAVGIYAAFGRFDEKMEKLFLGITDGHYTGGRLANYVKADTEEKKSRMLEELSVRISAVLRAFSVILSAHPGITPYEYAILLEENMEIPVIGS